MKKSRLQKFRYRIIIFLQIYIMNKKFNNYMLNAHNDYLWTDDFYSILFVPSNILISTHLYCIMEKAVKSCKLNKWSVFGRAGFRFKSEAAKISIQSGRLFHMSQTAFSNSITYNKLVVVVVQYENTLPHLYGFSKQCLFPWHWALKCVLYLGLFVEIGI